MNPTVPVLRFHPTRGLVGRKLKKATWALTLLSDPETFNTYEEYARESALEAGDPQPQPTNPPRSQNSTAPHINFADQRRGLATREAHRERDPQ